MGKSRAYSDDSSRSRSPPRKQVPDERGRKHSHKSRSRSPRKHKSPERSRRSPERSRRSPDRSRPKRPASPFRRSRHESPDAQRYYSSRDHHRERERSDRDDHRSSRRSRHEEEEEYQQQQQQQQQQKPRRQDRYDEPEQRQGGGKRLQLSSDRQLPPPPAAPAGGADDIPAAPGPPGPPQADKTAPNLGLSGKLAAETNTVQGVVLKFQPPQEARVATKRWKLYEFKGGQLTDQVLMLHKMPYYLFGRDQVADYRINHPSCSKQHAVICHRLTEKTDASGVSHAAVRPYLMCLGAVNGTFLNDEKLEPQRFYELLEKDMIKFGLSSREYVLLHEDLVQ